MTTEGRVGTPVSFKVIAGLPFDARKNERKTTTRRGSTTEKQTTLTASHKGGNSESVGLSSDGGSETSEDKLETAAFATNLLRSNRPVTRVESEAMNLGDVVFANGINLSVQGLDRATSSASTTGRYTSEKRFSGRKASKKNSGRSHSTTAHEPGSKATQTKVLRGMESTIGDVQTGVNISTEYREETPGPRNFSSYFWSSISGDAGAEFSVVQESTKRRIKLVSDSDNESKFPGISTSNKENLVTEGTAGSTGFTESGSGNSTPAEKPTEVGGDEDEDEYISIDIDLEGVVTLSVLEGEDYEVLFDEDGTTKKFALDGQTTIASSYIQELVARIKDIPDGDIDTIRKKVEVILDEIERRKGGLGTDMDLDTARGDGQVFVKVPPTAHISEDDVDLESTTDDEGELRYAAQRSREELIRLSSFIWIFLSGSLTAFAIIGVIYAFYKYREVNIYNLRGF